MKKFLIGVIFIIPIVVVVALSATGAIISLTTPVNPAEMVIKNSDNVEIDRNTIIKVDSRNYDEFIIIDVLPNIAQDKAIEYERVEEAGQGEIELEQIGATNRYSIIPKKIGVTKLEIRAKANVNVYREVTFYVSSDSIETMTIYDGNGQEVGEFRELSGSERFYVDINPFDAVRDNNIQWDSSNTTVCSVSQNGFVEIKGRGLARIKVTAVDKDGNTVSDYVDIDTTKAIVKQEKVYVSAMVDEAWVMSNVVLDAEASVVNNLDGTFTVISEAGETTITIVIAEPDQWDIVDLPEIMYLRNGGYEVNAKNLITGEELEDLTIECVTSDLIEYESTLNQLIPLKTGNATVKVGYNGEVKERVITIKDNPVAFELDLGSGEQKLGIQLNRTWGLYWLDENNTLTTEFRFGLADKSNTFDVEWSVNDGNFADITRVPDSQDIVINFKEASKGNAVIVTATLKINNFLQHRVKRSFTFNIKEQKNSINVYTFEQAKWVRDFRFYNIVLQNDIVATERIEDLTASVYGNGFKWDGTAITNMDLDDGAIEYDFEELVSVSRRAEHKANYELFLQEQNNEINFEDMIMFNAKTLEESQFRGSGIKSTSLWHETRAVFNDYPEDIPVNFRYLQVYNTHRGIEIGYHYNVLVEGCILGDNAEDSVFAYFYNENDRRFPEKGNNITFRNNVFKISKGPSVMLASVPIDFGINSKVNCAPNLKFEGFNDFYNWQTKEEFYNSVASLIGNYVNMFVDDGTSLGGAINNILMPILSDVLDDVSKGDAVQDLYYNYAGDQYVSFGAMGLGALFYFDSSKVTIESEGLMLTDLPFRDSQGKPVGQMEYLEELMKSIHDTLNLKDADTLCNPSVIVCTDFASGDPEIQPGDPIPNSRELYSKLRGN
ncbi:MAG: Ig-like domain-containing protein [Clostridia bacterium]|nr:Ig-like domain-containing protein [Clostridia bacterium]